MARSWSALLGAAVIVVGTVLSGVPVAAGSPGGAAGRRTGAAPITVRMAAPVQPQPVYQQTWQVPLKATEPPAPRQSVPVKIEGIVASIDGIVASQTYSLLVNGTEIAVYPDTEIRPIGATPAVDDSVIINASLIDAAFTATRVQIRAPGSIDQLEFRGLITGLPEGLRLAESEEWTIGGKSVEVSKATVVGTPALGFYAHVKGWLLGSSRIRATWVNVWDPAVAAALFEFEGVVQEMNAGTESYWIVDGTRGRIEATTVVEGTPEIGSTVEVEGHRLGDGSLVFDTIRVLTRETETVRLVGLIEEYSVSQDGSLLEGYIVVSGQRAEIDGMTFIDESGGRIRRQMWAEVVARPEFGGLYALRIRVDRAD